MTRCKFCCKRLNRRALKCAECGEYRGCLRRLFLKHVPSYAFALTAIGLFLNFMEMQIKYSGNVNIEPVTLAPITGIPSINQNELWAALTLKATNQGLSRSRNIKIDYEISGHPCRDAFDNKSPGMVLEPFDLQGGEERVISIGYHESLECLRQYQNKISDFVVKLHYEYRPVLGNISHAQSSWIMDTNGSFRNTLSNGRFRKPLFFDFSESRERET